MTRRPEVEERVVNGDRRDVIEQWLERAGVDFEYVPNFLFSQIDLVKSQTNQARDEPLLKDKIPEYREAIRRGDRFPALVVARGGAKAQAVIIDGNNRASAAMDAELETFGVYVVHQRYNTNVVRMLTMTANGTHGAGFTNAEKVHHAIWMIENLGSTIEAAAAAVNATVSQVRTAYDRIRADQRADSVGINRSDWNALMGRAPTIATRLLSITTDEGFKAAAQLTISAGLSSSQVEDMLARLTEAGKSADRQTRVVRTLKKEYADRISDQSGRARKPPEQTPRRQFGQTLTRVLHFPPNLAEVLEGELEDPADRKETASRARDAARRLNEIADALEG